MKNILLPLLFSCTGLACGNAAPGSAAAPEQTVRHALKTDTLPPGKTPGDSKIGTKKNTGGGGATGHKPPPPPPAKTADIEEVVESGAPAPAPRSGAAPGFADIQVLDETILLDIRYATPNNFTKSKIYDCPRCLLRPEAAQALVKAQRSLKTQGLRFKVYDCYRPRPYQQRLWDKVPNPDYVTPPAKGSMHSRGAAVDITLVDAQGNELDMGTPYDFFGPEAHSDHTQLSAKVLANRRLLRQTLEAAGFEGIRTEWWHFSYRKKEYPLSDYLWECKGRD